MASKKTTTTTTSSTVSDTKSTTTMTDLTSASTTVTTTRTTTDSFVQQTDETASTDSTRMTTDTAIATSHYHQKQDKSQQHQKAQSSANVIQTLHELLSLPASMELCQIDLIYRAEGNANLVLALPQFKKVLRLPKSTITSSGEALQKEKESKFQQQTTQAKEQQPHKQAQKASVTAAAAEAATTTTSGSLKVDLTMSDFTAYMQVLQQLLGSSFVLEADICCIAQEADRKWINKHISSARPTHRLDKEFCGPFGLLLPDATQLPMQQLPLPLPLALQQPSPTPSIQTAKAADILHSNLQKPLVKLNKDPTTSSNIAVNNKDTYAIEIKPKQGWLLLPNPRTSTNETGHVNVNDLFDIRQPTATPTPTAPTTATPTASTSAISTTPTAAKVEKTKGKDARCRYCAMQFLKLKNHKISNLSSYCPIELFSGVPSRMLAALDALFHCPQNNLRVFKNGILIYGDHASSISYKQLCDDIFPGDTFQLVKHLLVECLLKDYDDVVVSNKAIEALTTTTTATTTTTSTDKKMAANVAAVVGQPHSSVTAKVESSKDQATSAPKTKKPKTEKSETETETKASNSKKKQETQAAVAEEMKMEMEMKMLTPAAQGTTATTTTTTIGTTSTTVAGTPSEAQINVAEIQCLPKNCILQKILHLQLLVKHNLASMQQAGFGNYTKRSYEALNSLLKKTIPVSFENLPPSEQYLLGATALDCSIMLAFQECAPSVDKAPHTQIVNLANSGVSFLTKVTMLDLDPKPDSHFSKYVQQTKDAYAALNET